MGTSISTPPDRSVAEEGRETLQAQVDLAPQIYAARAEYDPRYTDLNLNLLRRGLFGTEGAPGLLQTYEEALPSMNRLTAAAQASQRESDIADVERLGGRASEAFRTADPRAAEIEDTLATQAMDELRAGASLDPALRNEVTQGVRAAQAARGFGMGQSDASVEGLFLGREAENMRRARQSFATDVAARRRAANVDPFLAVLGRQSVAPGLAGGAVQQGGGLSAGAQQFDPWTSYASDVYNTNYNAAAAANIGEANNRNALAAAGIEAAGSIGGAGAKAGGL